MLRKRDRSTTNVSNSPSQGTVRHFTRPTAAMTKYSNPITPSVTASADHFGSSLNSHQRVSDGKVSVRGRSYISATRNSGSHT